MKCYAYANLPLRVRGQRYCYSKNDLCELKKITVKNKRETYEELLRRLSGVESDEKLSGVVVGEPQEVSTRRNRKRREMRPIYSPSLRIISF